MRPETFDKLRTAPVEGRIGALRQAQRIQAARAAGSSAA